MRVLNLKALAQLLRPKLAWTKYPLSSGTDRQTDGRTSSTLYPLVFTGDNKPSVRSQTPPDALNLRIFDPVSFILIETLNNLFLALQSAKIMSKYLGN